MKKSQLIELIQLELGENNRFGDRSIALKLDLAFAGAMFNVFRNRLDEYGLYRKFYNDQTVKVRDNKTRYVDIPVSMLQVPGPDKGIIITLKKGRHQEVMFAGMMDGQTSVFSSLEAGVVDDVVGFIVNQGSIEFDKNMPEDIERVNIGLVVAPSQYDDDDELIIPSGVAHNVVAATVDLLKSANPYKQVDNENPNTP